MHPVIDKQPHAATIAFVHADDLVNIGVVDSNGYAYSARRVILVQDGEAPDASYATWMEYQRGQASAADTKGGLMDRVSALERWRANNEHASTIREQAHGV